MVAVVKGWRVLRGLVAAGHPVTARAAAELLSAGGSAADAVVAAAMAATVAEPCLTSPAGGGFCLWRSPGGTVEVLDGFVTAPGLDAATIGPDVAPAGAARPTADGGEPRIDEVPIRFAGATQLFGVGPSSVGVPGALAMWLAVHDRHGRLPLADVVAPAAAAARAGVTLDSAGGQLVELLAPVLTRTPEGRRLFAPGGRVLGPGDRFVAADLADLLNDVATGRRRSFTAAELGGAVTAADVAAYEVVVRAPLRIEHAGAVVRTNPAPALGGRLVAHGLADLAAGATPVAAIVALAGARRRFGAGADRGTTHISVADADGAVAAMTSSNGSGSGEFVPGTGVQLNNVMGEADLQPAGPGTAVPGERIASMMAPTVIEMPDGQVVALGSGGSERIRSALTLVVDAIARRGVDPAEAVRAGRIHWDGTTLQIEPGAGRLVDAAGDLAVNRWPGRDLYFGGVHLVAPPGLAVGDPRRSGVGLVVS